VLTVLERSVIRLRCSPQQSEETLIVQIAVLDDWQYVARSSADWSRLAARADLAFFADAFGTEDEAAVALADFDILLTMRERTAFPETLIRRLPKLRMISITGASNTSLDVAACTRQGITVCNTAGGGPGAPYATAELALGLLIAAARAIPIANRTMRVGGLIIAALDVYDKEPLPQDHPFRASDHTVLTPHLGYGVVETWRDFYPRSIENAEAFLDGKPFGS
jgi:phosphoglycerate dehydrogenase-like enzyme